MRSATLVFLFLLAPLTALSACKRAADVVVSPGPASTPEPASPASTVPPVPTPATWPAPAVAGIPGWLGLRAGQADSATWTSISGSAELVVPGEAWAEVPPGTKVEAVGVDGTRTVTFRGVETARFGCDGGFPLEVAAFDGAPPGELVWLLPPGQGAWTATAASPVDTASARTWGSGEAALGWKKTGEMTAELWAGSPPVVLDKVDLAADAMDGWEPEPVDLSQAFLMPQVLGTWSGPDGVSFALAPWSSFEGEHFSLVRLGKEPALHEVGSLYRCAF